MADGGRSREAEVQVLGIVIAEACCVLLLAVIVAGLLRSHADILRALHSLGAGVGDPTAADQDNDQISSHAMGNAAATAAVLTIGPPLPRERSSRDVFDVNGVTPSGDAIFLSVTSTSQLTLLAFLSSGCSTCAGMWSELAQVEEFPSVHGVRVVIVTKGAEHEIAAEVARLAPSTAHVVMSSQAWSDYEVPGSPFFVLVDGRTKRRLGEGVAQRFSQVAGLIERALVESGESFGPAQGGVAQRRIDSDRLNGKEREWRNDQTLREAGILPGNASLYPRKLADVVPDGLGRQPK